MSSSASAYRLVRPAARPVAVPVLDTAQQEVVDHRGGPLLVLAGPGTGKTTTVVEAVVARIAAGADPEQVLVLTFGRRAAAELRSRITARLGRATKEPLARTFHSYAFGVLRREAAARGEPAPRLLAGPEQDLVVRDLLAGDVAAGAVDWPDRLRAALATRGFAQELRDLVMRAYERGVTAEELHRLGRVQGRDDWQAAARFMRQYAGVTALQEAASYDPAELIRAVVGLWLREPALLAAEQAARPHVFVDELQDTDPAQVELLTLLSGQGRDLVAVGDPDQAIYGFRGADVTGIRSFRDRFRTATDAPAPIVALSTCRRSGTTLLAASRRVSRGLGGPRRHRDLLPASGLPPGELSVAVLRSEAQEAAHVAARLRHAHLVEGVPWSQMAVLVRSTVHAMPVLRRAMVAAGVPVAVSGDEVPLMQEPAVRPLLLLLRCATRPETPRRGRRRRAAHLLGGRRRRDGSAPSSPGAAPGRARRRRPAGVRRAARRGARRPHGAGLARPVGHPAGRHGGRPARGRPRRGRRAGGHRRGRAVGGVAAHRTRGPVGAREPRGRYVGGGRRP